MASKYIPKIIHQSFATQELPKEIVENIEKIKKINPTWEYRFYDDNDVLKFIKDNYPKEILDVYMKINPVYGAARADFFRYLLIYKQGGLWLDIKSTIEEPIDLNLREDDFFILSQWQNKMGEKYQGWGLFPELMRIPGGEFQQWNIFSAPNNEIIKTVIENTIRQINTYDIKTRGVGRKGVLLTTGPIIYTLSILPHLKKNLHRFVDIEKDFKIKYTIYDQLEYRKIYKKHYSLIEEPVIL